MSRWLTAALLVCLALAAQANIHLEAISRLPQAEQYRQLSLMLLVSAGSAPDLADALAGRAGGVAEQAFDPDDYTTPLARIVDQESMLAGAAQLFRFARDQRDQLRAGIDAIEADNATLASAAVSEAITADAIIIRNAIADAIEFGDVPGIDEALTRYRVHTVYLRNVMEYESYSDELALLTADAIQSVGGKLDAYQRMFDDETGTETFDRHIQAAESVYTRGEFDPRAAELTDEMIRNWILSESQPNR